MQKFKKTLEAKESPAERAFVTHWLRHSVLDGEVIPMYREHRFSAFRDWRFDFAWPDQRVAVEIEGGVWMKNGGHTSGKGYQKDCEKYNAAIEQGWYVLRFTPQMVERDPIETIKQIERVIRSRQHEKPGRAS